MPLMLRYYACRGLAAGDYAFDTSMPSPPPPREQRVASHGDDVDACANAEFSRHRLKEAVAGCRHAARAAGAQCNAAAELPGENMYHTRRVRPAEVTR